MPTKKSTIIYIVLGLVVLSAAAYMLFFRGSATSPLSNNNTPVSGAEFTFLTLAARIEPIVFDTSVLQDPRFLRLVDLRTAILPETSGRDNPFAPL
ncbi:hypothetical protein KKH15_02960 [Patescibacteria group bacterium]|nr:hypothetical protein [Patescibacteria group bacterium]MBU1755057.1 hypothetical protein [Patescibacteria group bacterium]